MNDRQLNERQLEEFRKSSSSFIRLKLREMQMFSRLSDYSDYGVDNDYRCSSWDHNNSFMDINSDF